MGVLDAFSARKAAQAMPAAEYPEHDKSFDRADLDHRPVRIFRMRIFAMAMIVSLGGMIFGFDTGQISGFVAMDNFRENFADIAPAPGANPPIPTFSNTREGLIVALLSIGTLVGALISGPTADLTGRKRSIVLWCVVFIIGVIVQISTETKWYQLAIGRLVAGFGVGGLSVLTPMYQGETAPKMIRGSLISAYQLFITFGIFLAYCINYGTETMQSRASWRITAGVGFIFPFIMAIGIMFLRESPRWDYRNGRIDEARKTIALSYGVPENHVEVVRELGEIKAKFDAESAGGAKHPWYEIFTGPRMAYRTLLGMSMQSLQQLTGANYFFYYGTTVFTGVGLSNSFVTQMILGGINFGMTFPGLYIVDHFGRRNSLITGACGMFVCFMIFASVGTFVFTPAQAPATFNADLSNKSGIVMIVFTAIFVCFYATTWGPGVWALVAEIYPSRYRSKSLAIATASNWVWNFLISYFTPYITADIGFKYGYIFASCSFLSIFVVYFFVCESQGRTLEEIDSMYISHVNPWHSKSWQPEPGEQLGETDAAYLTGGARDIRKLRTGDGDGAGVEKREQAGSSGELTP